MFSLQKYNILVDFASFCVIFVCFFARFIDFCQQKRNFATLL